MSWRPTVVDVASEDVHELCIYCYYKRLMIKTNLSPFYNDEVGDDSNTIIVPQINPQITKSK